MPVGLFRFRVNTKMVNYLGILQSSHGKASSFTGQRGTETPINVHASSRIQTHSPSVRIAQDCTHMRPRDHCGPRMCLFG